MSQAGGPTSGGGGPGNVTLDGDVSFATGATISIITGVSTDNSGSTFEFVGNGTTTLQLNITDAGGNTLVGKNSGNATLSGTGNTALGDQALGSLTTGDLNTAQGSATLESLTSGNQNVGVGSSAGVSLLTGSANLLIGNSSGSAYVGAESSNILLNSTGVATEGNTLRIGAATGTGSKQLSKAFVAGITGNTVSNTQMVTINSVTNQLGVQAVPVDTGIVTLDGDTGSATGTTVTITALDGADNSGSSVKFVASAAKVVLNVTDANQNTIVGQNAGAIGSDSSNNTALGYNALSSVTEAASNVSIGSGSLVSLVSGIENCALGEGTAPSLVSGNYNVYIGAIAGSNNASNEESNVYINSPGAALESNTFRVGFQTGTGTKQLSKAFISGINGNTVSNTLMVTIDSSSDQLGTQAIPDGSLTWIDEAVSFNAIAGRGYFISASATATLPTSPLQGTTIKFVVTASTGTIVMQAGGTNLIKIGNANSSAGGTATAVTQSGSTIDGTTLELVYQVATTTWYGSVGFINFWSLA